MKKVVLKDEKRLQGGIHKCKEVPWCNYKTTDLRNLLRHIQTKHRYKRLKKCLYCDYQTTSTEKLKSHKKEHKGEVLAKHHCTVCNLAFKNSEDFANHLNERHPASDSFELIQTAFSKQLRVYCRNVRQKAADTTCLWSVFQDFKLLCRGISAKEFPVFRTNICMYGVFEKSSPDDDEEEKETEVFVLKSTHFTVTPKSKLKKLWSAVISQFDDRIENLLMKGSGYTLTEVLKIHIEISEKRALKYACQNPQFKADIATEAVDGKKHLINVQNSKYNCFLSCLAFHFMQKKYPSTKFSLNMMKDASETERYYDGFINSLNFEGTGIYPPYQKPVKAVQIKKLLKANEKLLENIQVNIFGLLSTEKQVIYAYETGLGKRESENVLNLLSIPLQNNEDLKKGEKAKTQQHLVVISDLDAFMTQKTGKKGNRTRRKLCLKCFNFFKNDSNLKKHKLSCYNPRGQAQTMPEKGELIEFDAWSKKFPSDVTGFLDFETVQVDDKDNPEIKTLLAYQYSLVFVDKFNNLLFEKRGFSKEGKAGEMCLDTLLEIEDQLFSHARRTKKMKMSKSEAIIARGQKKCHICEKEFQQNEQKVRDHCHYSGIFLGMAHTECNVKRTRQRRINIYCHNGSAFDFHFLICGKLEDERINYIDGLPDSQERLRLLRLNDYVFKDTITFLKNSLDSLVKDLKIRKPNHPFKILSQSDICLSNDGFDQERFEVLKSRKSRLPYEKLTMPYLFETTQVPEKVDYYSALSNTHIDEDTYSDIKKFWSLFNCKNLAEYSSYYVSIFYYLSKKSVIDLF